MSNSLAPRERQQDSHDAIHAGQQLFGKEFRYLRTIRVMAAVHWSFQTLTFMRVHYLPVPGRRQALYNVLFT